MFRSGALTCRARALGASGHAPLAITSFRVIGLRGCRGQPSNRSESCVPSHQSTSTTASPPATAWRFFIPHQIDLGALHQDGSILMLGLSCASWKGERPSVEHITATICCQQVGKIAIVDHVGHRWRKPQVTFSPDRPRNPACRGWPRWRRAGPGSATYDPFLDSVWVISISFAKLFDHAVRPAPSARRLRKLSDREEVVDAFQLLA